jgi:hypothetical protein
MNKLFTKRFGALMISILFTSSVSFSQLKVINGDFFKGSIDDGRLLLKSYIAPFANAFGAGFNGGWYNTAKPHKLGGFDITFSVNVGLIPTSAQTVDLKSLNLQTLTLTNPTGSSITPTIAGSTTVGPELHAMAGSVELAKFKSPAGLDFTFMPVPILQAGIGLPLGTEVKIRYFPQLNIKDYKLGIWGVGLVHSITQYLPGHDLMPFDVSLFGGYSKLTSSVPVSVQPGLGDPTTYVINYVTYNVSSSFVGQNIAANVAAWNLSLIGSVKLAVLTFYGGLGYSKTKTDIAIKGSYPLPKIDLAVSLTKPVYEDSGVIKNIAPLTIENFSGLRANIGFRLKLAVLTIHADFTHSQYNVASAGLGMSFR